MRKTGNTNSLCVSAHALHVSRFIPVSSLWNTIVIYLLASFSRLMRVGAVWRHFKWNILPPSCGSVALLSYERFVQNSDSTWRMNVHRMHCRCPHCSTYTYYSFCRRIIDDETFVFLHGACYRVSGIVPLCMTLMRPFNAKKLLWSGKYIRTPCILHTSLSSTLQMYKELDSSSDWAPEQPARTDIPPHPHLQNVRTLRSPTFSSTGSAKWPRPETDREITNVWSCKCWRYLSGVT